MLFLTNPNNTKLCELKRKHAPNPFQSYSSVEISVNSCLSLQNYFYADANIYLHIIVVLK